MRAACHLTPDRTTKTQSSLWTAGWSRCRMYLMP